MLHIVERLSTLSHKLTCTCKAGGFLNYSFCVIILISHDLTRYILPQSNTGLWDFTKGTYTVLFCVIYEISNWQQWAKTQFLLFLGLSMKLSQ